MNYNHIFENNKLNKISILDYGFQKKESKYILKKEISEDFYMIFVITDTSFDVKVFDKLNNEEYIPFNIKSSTGSFVANMRDTSNKIVEDIVSKCFINENIRNKILNYVKEKYNTTPDFPWKKYPTFCTLKENTNNKWYGLIMNIPFNLLLENKESSVDVINIKLESQKIKSLIDNVNFFPAYHMNKKYWITILLNSNISFEKITELIDESYNLVCKK